MEPGPELQKLLKQILNQDPQLATPALPRRSTPPSRGRLPTPLTSFIGRETELEGVRSLLVDSRLVSVFAIEAGDRLAPGYRDGVRYVDLAPLTKPDLLPHAVLSALGLRDQATEDVLLLVVNHLASRQLLLVLDNCEHVAEASARLIDTVLMLCPEVRVLATTRETLGLRGESIYRLPGLPFATDSVTLFLDRAGAISPSFDATAEQIDAIQRICEGLDGIPLAIELAAARLTVMTPHEILQRLDARLDLLTTGSRTSTERQGTLNATIDWSYRLLTDEEQRLFRNVSVCRGWFGLEAAEEVGGSNGSTTDVLARLVDKSMLMPGVGDRLGRCRMLETVREFATRRLEQAGETEPTARRHGEHYLSIVQRAAPHLRMPDQRHWIDSLDHEFDNIRVALEWSIAGDPQRGLKAVAALENYWFRARQTEGRFWVSRFLQVTEGDGGRARADALYVAQWLAWMQGDYDVARRATEEMMAVSTLAKDRFNRARGRRCLSCLAYSQDDHALAMHLFSEAIPDLRENGPVWEIALALNDYSYVLRDLGRTEEVRKAIEEAVALAQESTDPWLVATITESAATFAMLDGNVVEARRLWRECLRIQDHLGDQWAATFVVDGLARLELHEGRPERALGLLAASSVIRHSMGSKPVPMHQRVIDDVAARSRALLDPARAETAMERGRGLSWSELVAYALEA
jgi:predicted ATPase